MPTANEPVTKQEPAVKLPPKVSAPKAPPPSDPSIIMSYGGKGDPTKLTRDDLIRRSLEDKLLHLNEEMAKLKKMPPRDARESIRRTGIALANVQKELAAVKQEPKESPKT